MEDITKSEKAALYFQILERCNDWKEVYKIAIGEDRYNALTDKTKITNTSRWKASHKIQKAKEEIEMIFKAKQQEIEERAKESNSSGETEPTKRTTKNEIIEKTNFLNLEEFLQYANQQANSIQDEKERRAWVEMIGKYMNFKESEEGETEQIKAYLPIICEACECYKRCQACKLSVCPVEV